MLEVTEEERELLIECIQYRLETDKTANTNETLREELEELLFKVEESDEYV
jgi:cell shape-determining protein MreC